MTAVRRPFVDFVEEIRGPYSAYYNKPTDVIHSEPKRFNLTLNPATLVTDLAAQLFNNDQNYAMMFFLQMPDEAESLFKIEKVTSFKVSIVTNSKHEYHYFKYKHAMTKCLCTVYYGYIRFTRSENIDGKNVQTCLINWKPYYGDKWPNQIPVWIEYKKPFESEIHNHEISNLCNQKVRAFFQSIETPDGKNQMLLRFNQLKTLCDGKHVVVLKTVLNKNGIDNENTASNKVEVDNTAENKDQKTANHQSEHVTDTKFADGDKKNENKTNSTSDKECATNRHGSEGLQNLNPVNGDNTGEKTSHLEKKRGEKTGHYFQSFMDKKDSYNVLFVGPSGTGKSTLINSIVNYFHYGNNLPTNDDFDLNSVIPSCFDVQDDDYRFHKVQYGEDSNENFNNPGHSVTQKPRVYTIPCGGLSLNIIDTPGLNDTRGPTQDDENVRWIKTFMKEAKFLHAVCFVLLPNEAKLGSTLKYVLQRLVSLIPATAFPNICFFFTNGQSTFFHPGDSLQPVKALQELIRKEHGITFEFCKKNVFCVDSDAFRYLVVQKHRPKLAYGNPKDFEKNWTKSCEAVLNFMKFLEESKPFDTIKDPASVVSQRKINSALERLAIWIACYNVKYTYPRQNFQLSVERLQTPVKACTYTRCLSKYEDQKVTKCGTSSAITLPTAALCSTCHCTEDEHVISGFSYNFSSLTTHPYNFDVNGYKNAVLRTREMLIDIAAATCNSLKSSGFERDKKFIQHLKHAQCRLNSTLISNPNKKEIEYQLSSVIKLLPAAQENKKMSQIDIPLLDQLLSAPNLDKKNVAEIVENLNTKNISSRV